ncbi:MAG: haloacid dehalogenase [Phycisphaerae bacterium]
MTRASAADFVDGIQGVFLDFYGTLAAGDRSAVEAICQQIINDYALTGSCSELAAQWGLKYFQAIEHDPTRDFRTLREIEYATLVETCRPYIRDFRPDAYIDRLNAYLASPPLFEEVREVLSELTIPTCIVSNADESELRSAVALHGLRFDYIVTSESARSYKPDQAIFRHALRLTGWSAERVLHVGDSLHSDIGGAAGLGIRTAWVNRGKRISDIGNATPDYTWADLRPLLMLTGGNSSWPS